MVSKDLIVGAESDVGRMKEWRADVLLIGHGPDQDGRVDLPL